LLILPAWALLAAFLVGHERERVRERGLGAEEREHEDGQQPEQAPELPRLRGLSSPNHHRSVFLIAALGRFVKLGTPWGCCGVYCGSDVKDLGAKTAADVFS
jgi:hypothetical protein